MGKLKHYCNYGYVFLKYKVNIFHENNDENKKTITICVINYERHCMIVKINSCSLSSKHITGKNVS